MSDVLNRIPEMLSGTFECLDEDQYENFAASPGINGLSIGASLQALLIEASGYCIMDALQGCLDYLNDEVEDEEDDKDEEDEEDVPEVESGEGENTSVTQAQHATDSTLPASQEEHDQKLVVQLEVLPANGQPSLSLQDSTIQGLEFPDTRKTPLPDGAWSSVPSIAGVPLSRGGFAPPTRHLEVVDLTEDDSDEDGPVRKKPRI